MSDHAVLSVPPARVKIERVPRWTDRLQSWTSLHLPGFWRMRIELVLAIHTVYFALCVSSPAAFFWFEGRQGPPICPSIKDAAYGSNKDLCWNSVSLDSSVYYFDQGFTSTEISTTQALVASTCVLSAMAWLFFVLRNNRLTEITPKLTEPTMGALAAALVAFAIWPIAIPQFMFAYSHSAPIETLFSDKLIVQREDGNWDTMYFPGREYVPSISFSTWAALGGMIVLLLSASAKIVIFDGVGGLLRTGFLTAACGLASGLFGYQLYLSSDLTVGYEIAGQGNGFGWGLLLVSSCGLVIAALIYAAQWIDFRRAIRKKTTQTLAMSLAVYVPGWILLTSFALFSALWGKFGDALRSDGAGSILGSASALLAFIAATLAADALFRRVVRVRSLPRP